MEKVNVGLIGAGGMANSVHYPSLVEFDDVNMAALCDLVPEKLKATAEQFKIDNTFTDYKKMVEEVDLDAIYILMPPHHLFDLVVHCLSQKLHVFIEKPPGVTVHQIKSMASLAEKNGCKTMVAFNRRFIPLMLQVREIVEEKGPIIQCMATFHKNQPDALYYNGAIDVLSCDSVHAVDIMRWMGGEVKSLASDINNFYSEQENSFNALMKFENGGSGFLCTNWAVGARIHSFEMHARGISAFISPDPDGCAEILEDSSKRTITPAEAAGSEEQHKAYGFYGENRHFIDCILQDKEPETCFSDAVKTMELVQCIYANRL